jgi:hypothetical protein
VRDVVVAQGQLRARGGHLGNQSGQELTDRHTLGGEAGDVDGDVPVTATLQSLDRSTKQVGADVVEPTTGADRRPIAVEVGRERRGQRGQGGTPMRSL